MFYLYLVVFLSIILESFPISSSGHLKLLESFFNFCPSNVSCFLNENLEYFLHGPTAIVIALFFYNRWKVLLAFNRSYSIIKKMFVRGIITDGITVAAYFFLLKDSVFLPLWVGFFITAVLLFSLYFKKNNAHVFATWNYSNASILGCAQALALIPGISRLGTTFVVARWLGFSAKKAFELSFLIEWPISAAAALKGTCHLYFNNQLGELLHLQMILIIIIAIVGALGGLWIMQQLFFTNKAWLFSFYMIIITMIAYVF